jgi:hypothetical protein
MRKWILVAVALVLVVSVPVTVMATGATHVKPDAFSGSGDVTSQAFSGRDSQPLSTSSKAWQDINNMSVGPICALGAVSVDLTVDITGSRAGFRVLIDGGAILQPGQAFSQSSGAGANSDMFSYTFVTNASTFEASDAHTFSVQWRSTGGKATLESGSILVQFGDPGTCT